MMYSVSGNNERVPTLTLTDQAPIRTLIDRGGLVSPPLSRKLL